MIRVQSVTFFKTFICNMHLHLFTSSRIITAVATVKPFFFFFKVVFEEGLLSSKMFLSVTSSKALIQRFSLMKYGTSIRFSFKIAALHIFRKFLENHQRLSSYSAQLWAFSMCSVVNDFLGISQNFSEQLLQGTWFLILSDYSVKISRRPFKPLTHGGNKRSHILKETLN